MIEERAMQLINADIDGELTSSERLELDAILESSADARAMKAELLRLSNVLDGLPQQEPPAELSKKIVRQISLPVAKKSFSLAELFSSLQPANIGMAFAAGLLLTVSFYELGPGSAASVDTAGMVGTMVANQSKDSKLQKNDIFLQGDGFTGTVSLNESEGIYVLNFDLESANKTDVKVGLGRTGLTFGGFADIQSDENKVVNSVAMSGSTLSVQNQGRQQFAVFLREASPGQAIDTKSITIDFSSDGDLIHQGVPES